MFMYSTLSVVWTLFCSYFVSWNSQKIIFTPFPESQKAAAPGKAQVCCDRSLNVTSFPGQPTFSADFPGVRLHYMGSEKACMFVPLIYLHVSTKICVNLGKLFNKVLSQAASFSLCTLWTNKGKGRLQMLSLFVFLPESIWKLFDPRFSFTQPIKARSREEMQVTPPHRS